MGYVTKAQSAPSSLFMLHSPVTEVTLTTEETQRCTSSKEVHFRQYYHGTDANRLSTGLQSVTGHSYGLCPQVHARSNNYDTMLDHGRQDKRGSGQGREKRGYRIPDAGETWLPPPHPALRKWHKRLGTVGL